MPHRIMPRSIRGLSLGVAMMSGLIIALLALATYRFVHEEIECQINQRIRIEADALLAHHRHHGFAALVDLVNTLDRHATPEDVSYLEGADSKGRGMGYIVTDASGRRRAGSLVANVPPPGWSEFVPFHSPDGGPAMAQAINTPLPGGGRLVVAADRAVVDQMDLKLLALFLSAFALILAVGTAAVIGLGRLVRGRLSTIEASAEAIMAGDLSRRMPLDGSAEEFDRLAMILNGMLDRIQTLMNNLKQVSGDIAHDLRTPLNRLRGRLEEVERTSTESIQQERLTAAIREADDLLDLFSSILAISEIEGQTVRSRFKSVELHDVIEEIAEAFRPAFEQAGRSLMLAIVPMAICGDRQLIQRCLVNLLDNALAHTPPGTDVTISTEARDGQVALTIADNGPGIADGDCERIFQRFARLDHSRSTSGYGLGLNMVAAIAAAHGGNVRVVPAAVGLTVEILLPTASNSTSKAPG
ncbi:HAMP domain-containing sensor histidine kinase [Sphingobium sp. SJ10-10]|uniref:sensor histidine kinase n=1 Tax=unclassified Sphingobium TaxID=2611147 RepID=UPI0007702749|nr:MULTISPECIES: HAMP domain-containing sensor histidine kinase [unclassified Sphingobium]AMK24639.1 sensory transduction histidine kinase [Sphingobium sp. TKS]MEC6698809.1 HAMP domain-containing sensor histidine kinase [Sphingobium sp. SJ10-10]